MKRLVVLFLLLLVIIALVIKTYVFQTQKDDGQITLYGNVDVRQVDLGFRANGKVVSMPFEEGDFVPQGALVAQLDDQPYRDLVSQAKARLDSISINYKNAETLLKRREALINDGSVSEEDLENTRTSRDVLKANYQEAEAAFGVAKTNLRDTQAFAPADGIILTRVREPGTVIKEGDPVYTLSVISPVWVRAYVPEPYLGVIYPNMPADIYTDSGNGKVYKGRVGFISPVAEFTPKTVETATLRTDLVYRLRVYADNPDDGLRQGMPVTVKLAKNSEVSKEKSE